MARHGSKRWGVVSVMVAVGVTLGCKPAATSAPVVPAAQAPTTQTQGAFAYPPELQQAAAQAAEQLLATPSKLLPGNTATLPEGVRWLDDGKPEVVEVFAYSCPHCADFQPLLEAWGTRRPDVRLQPLPFPQTGYQDPFARLFFAAEELKVLPRLHPRLFDAIHTRQTLPATANEAALLGWLAQSGFDEVSLRAAMHSPKTDQKMHRLREFLVRAQMEGTPTLIVNGKTRVIGNSQLEMLRITQALLPAAQAKP